MINRRKAFLSEKDRERIAAILGFVGKIGDEVLDAVFVTRKFISRMLLKKRYRIG